ncbi:MAG TPA: lipoprotein [Burkholderiaceae bacterium]|nr:lipoprotein [Burkholderiaceae bacterium]
MKPSFDPARRVPAAARLALSVAVLCSLLAGCGQKGPLYMPVRPAAATTPMPPKPPPASPAPSTAPAPAGTAPTHQ